MLTNKDLIRELAEQDAKLTKTIRKQTRWIIGFGFAAVVIALFAAKYL